MHKALTIVAAAAAVIAGVAVMQLKLAVQERADDVQRLSQKIRDDREAIRVLRAEWAYLTTPATLQDKSIRFLALMPPRADQIITDPAQIPMRPKGVPALNDPGVLRESAFHGAGGGKAKAANKKARAVNGKVGKREGTSL